MAVAEEILDKPSLLTAEEWCFPRRHTLIGERILGAAPAFQGVARIVRSSHEHWDRSGYPDGLRGQEIPLAARIILLCDAYHAITTDRPYQEHLTREAAIAELRRCSGARFDPELVELFSADVAKPLVVRVADQLLYAQMAPMRFPWSSGSATASPRA